MTLAEALHIAVEALNQQSSMEYDNGREEACEELDAAAEVLDGLIRVIELGPPKR